MLLFFPCRMSYIQCGARDYRFIAVTPFFTMDTIWKQKSFFCLCPFILLSYNSIKLFMENSVIVTSPLSKFDEISSWFGNFKSIGRFCQSFVAFLKKLNFIYLQDFPALREHCLAVDFAWLAVFLIPRDHWKNVLVTSDVEQRWQLSYGAYLCPSADYGQPGCLPALSYYRLAFCRIDATLEIRKIGFRTKWFNGKTYT